MSVLINGSESRKITYVAALQCTSIGANARSFILLWTQRQEKEKKKKYAICYGFNVSRYNSQRERDRKRNDKSNATVIEIGPKWTQLSGNQKFTSRLSSNSYYLLTQPNSWQSNRITTNMCRNIQSRKEKNEQANWSTLCALKSCTCTLNTENCSY